MDESPFSLMSLEEELTCSICLSTFDSPVTIPCGHNFCQDCLLATWKDTYSCPQCRTHFATKPELKKNTVLSTVVETFMLRSNKGEAGLKVEEGGTAKKEDVIRCDTCMEAKASQTCLTCMASFCDEHLRPHRENPNLSLHQLSDPVGDLMERFCPDHHKLRELFCTQHGRLICSLCLQVHKGCTFISPEEQKKLKESDLRTKLGMLDGKIEKTETTMFQINNMESKLKDSATNRKTALAVVYQEIRDMLAQDEREAQHEVDRELEIGLTKHRDFINKFTENTKMMRTAQDDINSLLGQSQTLAFLQASFDLPRVVKYDPHTPRINLDSKKVIATQTYAAALKEHLGEIFQQPVEARLAMVKTGEKSVPVSEGTSTGPQPESEAPQPPPQRRPPRSHSPGRPPIRPYFQPVPNFYMGPRPGWNPSHHAQGHPPGYYMAPFMADQRTKQDRKPHNAPGGNKESPSDFPKKDHVRSHPPSEKSRQHQRPNKNK
ncbi:hypothetical protein PAMP_020495 [Pampus punctatissimus]